MRRRVGFALLFAAAGAWAALAFATPAAGNASAGRTPLPVIEPAVKGEQCIAAPAVMRRDHMEMLKHQRDATVRVGIRGARASLKECIACHASAATGSVAQSKDNFCVSCHAYAAVTIDCFECHATRPAALARTKSK